MKRCGMLAILVLFLAVASPATASPSDQARSVIRVTGHAETTVVPDLAVLSVGVVSTASEVESARVENDRTMRRIVDVLTQQGVDKREITTSQFSLEPIYRSDSTNGGAGTIGGYRLQNTVSVTVYDLTKIGPVIDAVFRAGANQFQGLRFGLRDDRSVRDEVLKQAVLDGKHKADVIADALGVKLGRAVSVSEIGRVVPMTEGFRTTAVQATVPIEAGSLTVDVDASMEFGF